MKVDFLIVGAGYSGCVIADRVARVLGKKVLIVERRSHIGGNAFDYADSHGILVHKYGPHIFHTNSKKVWDYLSQFTNWRTYEHKVLAVVDGKRVPVPFNLNSLYLLFPKAEAKRIEQILLSHFPLGSRVPILKLREHGSKESRKLGEFIYEKIFLGYNLKQWGLRPEELDDSVTARVPVSISRDDRYFQDLYQGIPEGGYLEMFRRMVNHPMIQVLLNTDYSQIIHDIKFEQIVFTGPIDLFFDFLHGRLPYRSLRFEIVAHEKEFFQEVGTVNYPNDFEFTRITEFKYLTGQKSNVTTVTYEFPEPFLYGRNEPYYPIPKAENNAVYEKYLIEAKKLGPSVHFVGRLADYKYYNMDQVVARALSVFEKDILHA